MSNSVFYTVLISTTLLTLLTRVLPFALVKLVKFPYWVEKFLYYLPLTMMTALFFENLYEIPTGQLIPKVNFDVLFAICPALILGYFKRSLMVVVLTGIIAMACIRFFHIL
ncbi:AzlD domain-containing protein [Leuconostoc pseudomesenteroides]|uniref:AzlD domain-containing protein n=1 Tax=Leuconostoc pseudomesenteroides TaxID=33968 RepID=UPI003D7FB33B